MGGSHLARKSAALTFRRVGYCVTQQLDPLRSEVNANQSSLSHHERELAHHVSGSIVNTTERSLPQVCSQHLREYHDQQLGILVLAHRMQRFRCSLCTLRSKALTAVGHIFFGKQA
jgi:hypothetical protein